MLPALFYPKRTTDYAPFTYLTSHRSGCFSDGTYRSLREWAILWWAQTHFVAILDTLSLLCSGHTGETYEASAQGIFLGYGETQPNQIGGVPVILPCWV